ncbi:TIGR00659 family protein [Formivibrio citricus]|uniref:TIGR00659 family protein n=1 Tax=Formivibrio citricus TaxID=83765 RepID=A0A1I4WIE2_9NEIS|nr:LrgB family protein [Formivibrio citricus]SFN13448.1 TIGR00659 family protein [Formivibrio citricus]
MQALVSHPVLWLTLTIAAYLVGDWVFRRLGCMPLVHPVFVSAALLIPLLKWWGISYSQYFEGARFIHFLLGPATVALAIPLYSNLARVRQMLWPLLIALSVGGLTGIVSALLIGKLFGLSPAVLLSFAPKSVTTPIAMALAEKLGGNASVAAVAVVVTGVLGAMMVRYVLEPFKIKDDAVTGFALGLSSHGAGTAYAFQISAEAGAFSGLAMGMNAVFTSVALPLGLALWCRF